MTGRTIRHADVLAAADEVATHALWLRNSGLPLTNQALARRVDRYGEILATYREGAATYLDSRESGL